ncbi:MAG: DUF805 domain-containing protein [Thermohalobaculum sp.]|nr:DUF805 domain-containing protein [Thermohalobaculum sp.]
MRFTDAVLRCLGQFATFSGRSGRHEFWWFALFAAMAALGLMLAADEVPGLAPLAQLLGLGLVPPLAAVTVRRLHDTGLTGPVALIALVPGVGTFALAVLLARRGESHANRFGDDPRYVIWAIAV